jgi:hypothetical protein
MINKITVIILTEDDAEDDAEDDEGLPSRPKRPRPTPKHSLASCGSNLSK